MDMRGSNDVPEFCLVVLPGVLPVAAPPDEPESPPDELPPDESPPDELEPPLEDELPPDDVVVGSPVDTGTALAANKVPLKTLTKSAGESSGGILAMFCFRTLTRSAADLVASVWDSICTKGVPLVLPPVPKSNLWG